MLIDTSLSANYICNYDINRVTQAISEWTATNLPIKVNKAYSNDLVGFDCKAEKGYYESNKILWAGMIIFYLVLEFQIEKQYKDIDIQSIADKYDLLNIDKCLNKLELKENLCCLFDEVKKIVC